MKNRCLFLLVPLVLAVPAAQAAVPSLCSASAILARQIMTNRQKGVSLEAMMNLEVEGEDAMMLTHAMIRDAYNAPRYYGEEAKQDAIQEFTNTVLLSCLETFGEQE